MFSEIGIVLQQVYAFFFADARNLVFIIFILLFFFYHFFWNVILVYLKVRRINQMAQFWQTRRHGSDGTQDESLQLRTKILSALKQESCLKRGVTEFDKNWRDAYIQAEDAALCSIELKDFISFEELVSKRINRRMTKAVPGILVALGILGTFIGLVWTLKSLPMSNNTELTGEGTINMFRGIIAGLGFAFGTSIFGIACSIVFIAFERNALNKIEKAVLRLSETVSLFYPCVSESRSQMMLHRTLSEVNANMATMATDIAEKFSDVIEPAFDKAFGNHLTPAIESIKEAVEKMVSFSTENQVEGIQKLVDRFMGSMNEAMGDHFEELNQILAETVDSQKNIRDGLNDFSNSMREAAQIQESLIKQTTKSGETLKESLDRLEIISGILGDASEKIVTAGAELENSAVKAGQAQNIAREAQKELVESLQRHQNEMAASRKDLEEALSLVTKNTNQTMTQVQVALKELNTGISENLIIALKTFDSSLGETVERFSGTLAQVDGAISELPGATDQMKSAVEDMASKTSEIATSFSSYGQQLKKVEELVSSLQDFVLQMNQNIASVQEPLTDLASMGRESFDLTALTKGIQTINETMLRIEKSLSGTGQSDRKSIWPFGR